MIGTPAHQEPAFTNLTSLATERLGGKVLSCSDDFFAEKENLIKPGRGIFIADKYTDRGKWMDGWESRRKRGPGHDWCIVRLATTGKIKGVDIDTNHFLGNHPPFASIEACLAPVNASPSDLEKGTNWIEILPKSTLAPGSQNFYEITHQGIFSHIRLNIYPDGGVARLNVYGEVYKDWSLIGENKETDLAAAINGARAVLCNDMFFSHMGNLIMPGRGINMGDGWETKRNRTPNNRDWVIVRLAHRGEVDYVVIDTAHFKGNYPDSCILEGCVWPVENENQPDWWDNVAWEVILPQSKLKADSEHTFKELSNKGPYTHVRLSIFPDGGISRLRVFGRIKLDKGL
jgi:allantoicase